MEQKHFSGELDNSLNDLEPATFNSFSNAQQWKAFSPSSAAFPSSNFGLSAFEEPDVYRALDLSANSLNLESTRALQQGDFGESGVEGGGWIIGNDNLPVFPLNPKANLSPSSSIGSDNYSPIVQKNKLALSQVVVARVEPPSPPGGYLEPSYHVFSSANPTALMQSVLNVLAAQQVDCEARHQEFKIKCHAYRSCARLSFYVHVFSVGEGTSKRYAVEFQRRTGDSMHFREIYRSAKRSLAENQLIERVKASSIRPDQPAPPPLEAQVTLEQVKDTVKSLLLMVNSKFVDLKTQGLVALADLTASEPKVQSMMLESGVLDALVQELTSSSSTSTTSASATVADISRCAVTGLANLAHEREHVCQKIAETGAVKTLLQLAKSEVAQIARECARLLANLGSTLGKKVIDTEFKNVLKHIRGGRDQKAREYIAPLVEILGL
jgi:hypothetical protein